MPKVTLAATTNFGSASRPRDGPLPAIARAQGPSSAHLSCRAASKAAAPLLAPQGHASGPRSGSAPQGLGPTSAATEAAARPSQAASGAGERPTLYLYCLTARAPAGCRGKPGRWLHRYRSKLPWSKRCCRRTSPVPGSAAIPPLPRCAGGVRPAPAHRAATLLTEVPRSARAGVAAATGGALVRQGKRSPAPGQRGSRSRVASSGRKRLPGGRYRPGRGVPSVMARARSLPAVGRPETPPGDGNAP